ncbi:Thiol reductase thioredoxin [Beijerinckiaceae bacterium RH AL1]|nr:thioredoxin family protein [Beijerinckiaceae bacterium]VVB49608.1 Thiol reductase thioredoxin [Beijerinckiaceae bacterium RH CH11]VVB49686.1 Thiol reductase thioredoxin [Beijerinckiaceae bacterium RH AL8]VVC56989.1 Thiol reductase thioredoxin [Beijerinckiaceae bacterium RH AL1]
MIRAPIAAALVALTLAAVPAVRAVAAEQVPYSASAFAAAQAAGKPVVVDVTAPWCSTCAAQKPIVQALLKEPEFKNLVLLHVDFDTQKALLRKLNVREQSTFVVYKGRDEVGRSTGDTDKASIAALFAKAAG